VHLLAHLMQYKRTNFDPLQFWREAR